MDTTRYVERWVWVGVFFLAMTLVSPSAVLVGLALWLWLRRKLPARWRWVVVGGLLLVSWAGLVLLWGLLAGQLLALRQAVLGQASLSVLGLQVLPIWGEGTLLGPTIAGLLPFFLPGKPGWLVP